MRKFFTFFLLAIGLYLGSATYHSGSSPQFCFAATNYSGVYECEMTGDMNDSGYMKIEQTGTEVLATPSWGKTLKGTVEQRRMNFANPSMTINVTLLFSDNGGAFLGEWQFGENSGKINGTRVDPSLWPFPDYSKLLPLQDTDADGLPDTLEAKYHTDPAQIDTDGDSLSDYDEVRKYRTNPLKKDSDDDQFPDNDWNERREYTYSIQAIVDLRPPFDIEHMNDFYQDARIVKTVSEDVTRVEVILYPEAKAFLNPASYTSVQSPYTEPTYTKNYSPAMQEQLERLVSDAQTDIQAIVKVMDGLTTFSYVDIEHDLGYTSIMPLNFNTYVTATGEIIEEGMAETTTYSLEDIKARVLFADTMYQFKTHSACSSTSIIRGAMLRAAGIPERTIFTIPLLYTYEHDQTKISIRDRYLQEDAHKKLLNIPSKSNNIINHFLNEARIGNQWIRVDHTIDTGIRIPKSFGIKLLVTHDPTDYHFHPYWNSETWRDKRPYTYISVIDKEATHQPSTPEISIR